MDSQKFLSINSEDIGRFTSIDPLWEKYYGWTTYHYCGNNPVSKLDPSGLADFIDETGNRTSDGVNDGKEYATSSEVINKNLLNPSYGAVGPPSVNYKEVKNDALTYLMPSPPVRSEMQDKHFSDIMKVSEAGSVGNENSWKFGDRKSGASASEQVKNATQKACDEGLSPTWYAHDHPYTGFRTSYSQKPTNPEDYLAKTQINRQFGTNIQFGILFTIDEVQFFRAAEPHTLISIPLESFKVK